MKKSPKNQSANVSSRSGGGGNKSFLHTGPKKPVFAAAADEGKMLYNLNQVRLEKELTSNPFFLIICD